MREKGDRKRSEESSAGVGLIDVRLIGGGGGGESEGGVF